MWFEITNPPFVKNVSTALVLGMFIPEVFSTCLLSSFEIMYVRDRMFAGVKLKINKLKMQIMIFCYKSAFADR